ncbi:hypothetical protein BDV97DRAFT_92917 [Delphinella strobiligena]|nr:hypothetical protein BDV97DRAFT_92917 [Delphinella strobiligena]
MHIISISTLSQALGPEIDSTQDHSRPLGAHKRISRTTSLSQIDTQQRLESQSLSYSSFPAETWPDRSTEDDGTVLLTHCRSVPIQERMSTRRAESAPVHDDSSGIPKTPLAHVNRLLHLDKDKRGATVTVQEPAKFQHRTYDIDERHPENVAPRSEQVEPENGTLVYDSSKRAGLQDRRVTDSTTPSRHSASLLAMQSLRDSGPAKSVKTASEFSSSASISNPRKCHICQRTTPLDLTSLIACSTCRRKYHKGCHKPTILTYDMTWQCFHCNGKTNLVSSSSHQAVGANGPSRSHASSHIDRATCPPTKRIRYNPGQVTAQHEPYTTQQVPSSIIISNATKASTTHRDEKDEELATTGNKLCATSEVESSSANLVVLQSGSALVQERAIDESHPPGAQVLATTITETPDSLHSTTTDAADLCPDGRTGQDIFYGSEGYDSTSKPFQIKSQKQLVGGHVGEGTLEKRLGDDRMVFEEAALPSGPAISKTSGEDRLAGSQRSFSEIIADRIRKRKQPKFVALSLYDEHPEHHPDAASHRYEDRMNEISARPSRKQMFRKRGSRLEKEGLPGGLRHTSPGPDHKSLPQMAQSEALSSLEELLGQTLGVAPLMSRDTGQPEFHD